MARTALSAVQLYELNVRGPFTGMGDRINDIEQAGYLYQQRWAAPLTKSSTNYLAAVTLASGAASTGTVFAQQPDMARNVQVVVSLAGSNLSGNVTLVGTDIRGAVITEDIAVTSGTTYQSTLAYATLTSYSFPQRTTSGDTISLGRGDKLGLNRVFYTDSVILFETDTAKDTYTLVQSQTQLAANIILPNTATNGTRNFRATFLDERQ